MAGKITKRELSTELSTDINSRIKFVADNTSNIEIPGVDEKLNDINTKYDEITSQLDNIATIIIPLDNFKRLDNEKDDNGRILRALEYCRNNKGKLMLPKIVQLSAPILLKSYDKIEGLGKYATTIQVLQNFNGKYVIGLENDEVVKVDIRNLRIEGDMSLLFEYDGLSIINKYSPWQVDPYHVIKNVSIENVTGNGFVIIGRGGSVADNISVKNVEKTGIKIANYDSYYSNLSSGLCKEIAIDVSSGPHKMNNCKGWGSRTGIKIGGKNHALSSMAAQENTHEGIIIDGVNINLSCNIDGVGWDFYNNVKVNNATALILTSNSGNCNINGTISNGMFINNGHNDTIAYALKCESYYNNIDLVASDIQIKSIDPTSKMNTNTYNISGTKSYAVGSNGIMETDLFDSTTLMSDLPYGITYTPISSNKNGFPENVYGTYIIYKVSNFVDGKLYNFTEYRTKNSNRTYRRYVNADGSWGEWLLMPGQMLAFTKSTSESVINAKSTVTLNITGLTNADGEVNKDMFSVSPTSFPPIGIVWSYIFNGLEGLSIRVANITDNPITMPNMDWNIKIIK